MTSTFEISFTRYDRAKRERRVSRARHVNAVDFPAACARASDMLTGLREGDPASEFEVVSVRNTGFRGLECDGVRMWETAAEAEDRLNSEKAA